MKTIKLIIAFVALIFAQTLFAQQKNFNWKKWDYLIGKWEGTGNGQPGQGTGFFTFQLELSGKILTRKNHTEYPATKDKAAFVHDDMLIVYPDTSGVPSKAIYFDNEGHIINYSIDYFDASIILTSEIITGSPRFRLSYIPIDNKNVNIKFEIAMPQSPNDFKTYLEGKAVKIESKVK